MVLSNSGLSPKKDLAAQLLSQRYTQVEVARDERIDVTKQTLNNWCKDKEFQKKIEEYRTDLLKQAEEVFARNVGEAAEAIVEIAIGQPTTGEGEDKRPVDHRFVASKLKAALFIIDRTMGKKLSLPVKKGITSLEEEEEEEELDAEDVKNMIGFANA